MIERIQKFIFYEFISIFGHIWTSSRHSLSMYRSKTAFIILFDHFLIAQTGRKKQNGRKRVKKVERSCVWSTKDKNILLECSVIMLNYQLEIVGEEFVTSIGPSDEFYVNLHFDRSIYRPMCTHMDITYSSSHCILFQEKIKLKKSKYFHLSNTLGFLGLRPI